MSIKRLHYIQLDILRVLLFATSKRYSEIKPIDMESSQFKFHLDSLIKSGLIEKCDDGLYRLTFNGKEFANQMDTLDVSMRRQSKISAKICCVRDSGKEKEYLLYTRQKNPFFGYQGFPNAKIWYGESFIDGVKRGLYSETNLQVSREPELMAIRHYRVFSKEQRILLEDKTMFIYRIVNPTGELLSKKDGVFKWVKETEVAEFVQYPLPEFEEIVRILKGDGITKDLDEVEFEVNLIDF